MVDYYLKKKKLKNGDLDYLKEVDPTKYIYQIFVLESNALL